MPDENNAPTIDSLDLDRLYANYLETSRRAGIEPVPREGAFGLLQEWTAVLSGRPDPTTH